MRGFRRFRGVLALAFGIVTIGLLGRFVLVPRLAEIKAARALDSPLYHALERHEPHAYATVRATMIDGFQHRRSVSDIATATRPIISNAAQKYLLTADDQALVDAMRVTVDVIEQAAAKDPAVGYGIMYPGAAPRYAIGDYVSQKTLEQELLVTARLIESGAQHQAPPQNDERAAELLRSIGVEMEKKFGDDLRLLDGGWRAGVDKRRVCEMYVAMYRAILALPRGDAAQVLRMLLRDRN